MIALITVFARPAPNNTQPPCVIREMKRTGVTKIHAVTWCGDEHDAAKGLLQMPSNLPCCPTCTSKVEAFSQQLASLTGIAHG